MYENEKDVGRAVNDSGTNRADIFVTTKLWDSGLGYDHALKAFDDRLKKIRLEYVDLYIIHWPEKRFAVIYLAGIGEDSKRRKKPFNWCQ